MASSDMYPENNSAKVSSQLPVVVTQGEATVIRRPDEAWLTVKIETRDAKAEKARRISAESMTAVQAAIRASGIFADAIKTSEYWLSPDLEWKNGRSTVKGYIVRNQIEIRVDDLDNLSDVIDAANTTQNIMLTISGLRFNLKNRQVAEAEALRLAVQAALSRAQAIAAGAGLNLGRIMRIDEPNLYRVHTPEPHLMRAAMANSDEKVETPITIGDIEIQAKVILTAQLI
jgi:hypothetical protein